MTLSAALTLILESSPGWGSILIVILLFRWGRRQYRDQRAEKLASGWRPILWDENDPTVTEEEKVKASVAYALGEPIPLCGQEARKKRKGKR